MNKLALFLVFNFLCFSAKAQSADVIFQCESEYEGIKLNLKATKEKAVALYTTLTGKTYTCDSKISFIDLSAAQIPHYEANLLFLKKCVPQFTSDLSRMVSVEMTLSIPARKETPPEINWVNYRKAQKCVVLRNLLADHFKKK